MPELTDRAEIVVIGSGPGGSVAACLLAEAGRDVLLLEEGEDLPQHSAQAFSYPEMTQKYRNGGITVALGKPDIAYAEGRCVGGGSEINSGLYHRLPDDVRERWQRSHLLADFSATGLDAHFERCESIMKPAQYPADLPTASKLLRRGAEQLGWNSQDIPRLVEFTSEQDDEGIAISKRLSMSRSFLPRFRAAGGRLRSGIRATRLRQQANGSWQIKARCGYTPAEIHADAVFVCAGTVHTPALLRRSGIRDNVGDRLSLQPMLKLTAEFAEDINLPGMGIAGEQVKEFAPQYSFGCSISSPAHLAINLLPYADGVESALKGRRRLISYYVMSVGGSDGNVRNLPGFSDPLVRYRLSANERRNLAAGARDLSRLLLQAGATQVYTGVREQALVSSDRDAAGIPAELSPQSADLMTVHMMGSCPMGETAETPVDSFGQVKGAENLRLADASVLCDSPAVNPQGTIMALASRITEHFLQG